MPKIQQGFSSDRRKGRAGVPPKTYSSHHACAFLPVGSWISLYRRPGIVCEILIIANCEFVVNSQKLERIIIIIISPPPVPPRFKKNHTVLAVSRGRWPTTMPSFTMATALGSLSFLSSHFSSLAKPDPSARRALGSGFAKLAF